MSEQYGEHGSSQANRSNVSVKLDWNTVANPEKNTRNYTFNISSSNSNATKQTRIFYYTINLFDPNSGDTINIFDYALDKTIAANTNDKLLFSYTFTSPWNCFDSWGATDFKFLINVGVGSTNTTEYNRVALTSIIIADIDRGSHCTLSQSTVTLGETVRLTTNAKSPSFKHKILGKLSYKNDYEELANGVSSYADITFPFSMAYDMLYADIYEYDILSYTYDSDGMNVSAAYSVFLNVKIPSTFVPTITEDSILDKSIMSDGSTSFYQKFGAYVQKKSNIELSFTENMSYNSPINKRTISILGISKDTNPCESGVIKNTSNTLITAQISDSRGFSSTSLSKTVEILNYDGISFLETPILFRCDSSGTSQPTLGTYLSVKSSWTKSTLTRNGTDQNFVKLRIYKNDVLIHDSGSTTVDSTNNGSTLLFADLPLEADTIVKIELTDTAETTIDYTTKISPATRVMSFKLEKDGVAIGKMANKPGFEVEWDTDLNGDLNVDGDTVFNGSVDGLINSTTKSFFNSKTGLSNLTLDQILQVLINDLPGVGDYWITETTETPVSHFGFGTWVKVTDRMLVGAGNSYSVSAEGGAATHILTVAQIPSHQHAMGTADNPYVFTTSDSGTGSDIADSQAGTTYKYPRVSSSASVSRATYDRPCGGGTAHNNMPPYRAVNIWRRTA